MLLLSCRDRDMDTQIAPEEFQSLTIYDVDGFVGKDLDRSTLAKIPHVALEKDVVQQVFRDLIQHRRSKILWKGSWLGIATTSDGTERRIAISYTRGFFQILNQKGYYEIKGYSLKVFDEKMKGILRNIFIPTRPKNPYFTNGLIGETTTESCNQVDE